MNSPAYAAGDYAAKISKHTVGFHKSTNNFQVILNIDVIGEYQGSNPDADEDFVELREPFQRTIWLTLTANSQSWIEPLLRYLGWNGTDMQELDPESPNAFQFDTERVYRVSCEHRVFNNNTQDRWNIKTPTGRQSVVQKPEAKNWKTLNQTFRFTPVGKPATAQQPQSPPATPQQQSRRPATSPF